MESVGDRFNRLFKIKSIEVAIDHRLTLMTRWVVKLYLKRSERSIQYLLGTMIQSCKVMKGNFGLTTNKPFRASVSMKRYLFTYFMLVSFLKGRVPCKDVLIRCILGIHLV